MLCRACGHKNAPEAGSCDRCGAELKRRCLSCGSENPAAFRFCGNCGVRLQGAASPARTREDAAETRQLTVLFCDLVGSTILSRQLDSEDYREVLRVYQEACAAVVHRYEGRVASLVGDGLMIYFGYPVAHEDDPERAALAGLGIVEAVKTLAPSLRGSERLRLGVRIGIHTGLAVVGEMGHGDIWDPMASVGETPNIAARIQEQADKYSVLVSAATEGLLRGAVTTQPLGRYSLRGVAEPMELYAVVGERRPERYARAGTPTPFVGREDDLAWLRARWALAIAGTGQTALLAGEAGIGKSRLVNVFRESVAEPHHFWECRCSPYDQQSTFRPIIACLEQALGLRRDDSPEANLVKLKRALASCGPVDELLPPLATLLTLPGLERPMPHGMSARRQHSAVTNAVLSLIQGFARQKPLLFVVEDLHWSDTSTLELLARCVEASAAGPLLAIFTHRPEIAAPGAHHSHVARRTLQKLPAEPARAMVAGVSAGKPLPAAVVAEVVARADGVPLFLEELTRMMVHSDAPAVRGGDTAHAPPRPVFVVPSTLRDLLTARLDRLSDAKALAQLAAVIGREFSYRVLRATSTLSEPLFREQLDRLLDAELLQEESPASGVTYRFNHHLVQEVAYASLLRRKREEYHLRIAEVLEQQFADTVQDRPEIIAHHYTAGGSPERAIDYWRQAGELALKRSAGLEAVLHLRRGLELLAALPESPKRAEKEVLLQLPLGAALTAIKGYAAPEVAQAYSRAHALSRALGEGPQLFPILRGLQSFHMVRGPLGTAHKLGSQLLQLAEGLGDGLHLAQAHRRLGWCLLCLGNMRAGRIHLERAVDLYDRSRSPEHLAIYGGDPCVQGLVNLAWLDCFTGFADRGLQRATSAIKLAREQGHPLNLVYALCVSVPVHQGRGEPEAALALAEETGRVAAHHGFAYWEAWAGILRGWAMVRLGEIKAGLDQVRRELDRYSATGAELFRPYSLALLAEAYRDAGLPEQALKALDEAHDHAGRIEVHFYDAELHGLQGETLEMLPRPDLDECERCFHRAVAVAREHGALSLELRAVVRLARLLQRRGRREEANRRLAEVYGRFTEGWSSADLREAAAML